MFCLQVVAVFVGINNLAVISSNMLVPGKCFSAHFLGKCVIHCAVIAGSNEVSFAQSIF
jgi:hypothetical protein